MANEATYDNGDWDFSDVGVENPITDDTDADGTVEPTDPTSANDLGSASELNDVEVNTLTGEASLVLIDKSFRLKAKTTVKINGFGKYISGLFYVDEVKKSFSVSGFTVTTTLSRTGFGDSLKRGQVTTDTPNSINSTYRNSVVPTNME